MKVGKWEGRVWFPENFFCFAGMAQFIEKHMVA